MTSPERIMAVRDAVAHVEPVSRSSAANKWTADVPVMSRSAAPGGGMPANVSNR